MKKIKAKIKAKIKTYLGIDLLNLTPTDSELRVKIADCMTDVLNGKKEESRYFRTKDNNLYKYIDRTATYIAGRKADATAKYAIESQNDYIKSETFIDEVVARIKDKQL